MINDQLPNLSRPQWLLLRAVEFGGFDVDELSEEFTFLNLHKLLEFTRGKWRPSDEGRLLIALRREI
jgi:hypothetical protein